MPGFFVLGVFGILAVGGEEDVGLVVGRGQGENVEDVRGDYVGGEEVDLGWGVGDAVVVEVAFVGVAAVVDGAFDLDAEEVAPSVAIRSLRAGSLAGNSFLRAGYEEVVGGQSPQGRARISPCSVARSWKRSSAHSPRRLGCGMLGLWPRLGMVVHWVKRFFVQFLSWLRARSRCAGG